MWLQLPVAWKALQVSRDEDTHGVREREKEVWEDLIVPRCCVHTALRSNEQVHFSEDFSFNTFFVSELLFQLRSSR